MHFLVIIFDGDLEGFDSWYVCVVPPLISFKLPFPLSGIEEVKIAFRAFLGIFSDLELPLSFAGCSKHISFNNLIIILQNFDSLLTTTIFLWVNLDHPLVASCCILLFPDGELVGMLIEMGLVEIQGLESVFLCVISRQ